MKQINDHKIIIVLVLCGVIDQTTPLFTDLFNQLNAPEWVLTIFKIIVIALGAFKLYISDPKNTQNNGE